ncbi:MAG: type II toxin-antitoxin system RelE/ParE family toxin [Crocinitomicaceae bacterium]
MNITWTNRALEEYEAVVYYLLDEWTGKEAQKFITNVGSILTKICVNPYMFKASWTYPYMRKAKITKHNSIIYHVDGD